MGSAPPVFTLCAFAYAWRVCAPSGSICQSQDDRRSIPLGMLDFQKSIGWPQIT